MLEVAGTTIDLSAAAAVLPWVLAIVGPAAAWGTMRQQVKGNRELMEARLTALETHIDDKFTSITSKVDTMYADLKSDVGGLSTVINLYRDERGEVRERLATIEALYNTVHSERKG